MHSFTIRIWSLLGERRTVPAEDLISVCQVERVELEVDGNRRVAPHGEELRAIAQDDILKQGRTTTF